MKVRESLSELSELLERGERQGIFSSRMPPTIERAIREDNLRQVQTTGACEAVLRILDILGWIRIRIRGSMPLTNVSGSCYFGH
jgi:hypothetical protein